MGEGPFEPFANGGPSRRGDGGADSGGVDGGGGGGCSGDSGGGEGRAATDARPGSRGDRDAGGRFVKGNKAARGHGRPHAAAVEKIRSALLAAVSEADMQAVADALLRKAKAGDVAAIRELFDRLFGKAAPMDPGSALDDGGDDGPRMLRLSFDE